MAEISKTEILQVEEVMGKYFKGQFDMQSKILHRLEAIKRSQDLLTSIFVDARKNYEGGE